MKALKDKTVHYAVVGGRVDVPMLARQLAWAADEKLSIPTWLAALLCEKRGASFVFCRNEQIELTEFRRFRSKLTRRFHDAHKRGGKVPQHLEGLMSLFDVLYDAVIPPEHP